MRRNKRFPHTALCWAWGWMLFLPAICFAQAPEKAARPSWPDPVLSSSEILSRASATLLLDGAATANGRLVTVGERGHVLLSDDAGAHWRQAPVPTRSTLTGVASASNNVVAVGHDGVIVHSADGGDNWQRVREEPYSLENQASASNGAPLLDVLFLDDQRVIAIGAYSLMLVSDDGGASWQESPMQFAATAAEDSVRMPAEIAEADGESGADAVLFTEDELMLDDEADPHLNAIARLSGGELIIVGERGAIYRSSDEGATWTRLALSYDGSMFGVLALPGNGVLVYGLRGRVFESGDAGDNWRETDSGTQATLFAGAVGENGSIILVGNQGTILRRPQGLEIFEIDTFVAGNGETPALAGVQSTASDKWLLLGERGVAEWRPQP